AAEGRMGHGRAGPLLDHTRRTRAAFVTSRPNTTNRGWSRYLAVPGGQELITVTFTTPSIRHWPQYCKIMVEILHSIRLTPTEDDTEPQPTGAVPSAMSPTAPEPSRGTGGPTPFG
ncbi:hypothetical protein, partial [Streptomyces noursei]|uniref:hypothetical protein n=1 Tax=Streptomyces noursei TaxID=1971 RepID=UPI0030F2B4CE